MTIIDLFAEVEGLLWDYQNAERPTRPHKRNLQMLSRALVIHLKAQQVIAPGRAIDELSDDVILFLLAAFEMGAQAVE